MTRHSSSSPVLNDDPGHGGGCGDNKADLCSCNCDICEDGGDGVVANGSSNCVNFGVGGVGGSFQGQVEVVMDELALLRLL